MTGATTPFTLTKVVPPWRLKLGGEGDDPQAACPGVVNTSGLILFPVLSCINRVEYSFSRPTNDEESSWSL